jgi:hypothetical protein
MLKTNIENAMKLNGILLAKNKLMINSLVLHLVPPVTKNLLIDDFSPNKLLGQSLKNLVSTQKEVLKKNPVFFCLAKIGTFDKSYRKMFMHNGTLKADELERYTNNYEKSLDLIKKLVEMDPLIAAKSIWDVEKI